MAEKAANIIVAVKCDDHPPTFLRIFAESGELPLDTYRRVCEAIEPGGQIPDFVCAEGYAAASV